MPGGNRHDAPVSAAGLRREISARNLLRAEKFEHEVSYGSQPCVIYGESEGIHGNFLPSSYRRIIANPQWKERLSKAYSASRYVPRRMDRKRYELESACSSDALLMNIFCYPNVMKRTPVCALLGVGAGVQPEFGFRPAIPLALGGADRTEIDMKLGSLLVEAKLTEGDFQQAPMNLILRYRCLEEVFDLKMLPAGNDVIHSYQLVRGVLAAHATGCTFTVLCDRRRADLTEKWFEVLRAVEGSALRSRLCLLTWQEHSRTLPRPVRGFLAEKYGICG